MIRKLLWAWLAIGALLMAAGIAYGGNTRARLFGGFGGGCTRPNSPPIPAVCRVFAPDPEGVYVGSGSLVDVNEAKGVALVLTGWHVIRGATKPVSVQFPGGHRSGATVVKTDQAADLAALAIFWKSGGPKPLSVGQAVRPGERLTAAGWGPEGCWQSFTGPMTQPVSFDGGKSWEAIELKAAVREGDSGGPILNGRRELVGVISACRPPVTVGSGPVAIRRFLASILGPVKRPLVPIEENPPPTSPPPGKPAAESGVSREKPPVESLPPPPDPAATAPTAATREARPLAEASKTLRDALGSTDAPGKRPGAVEGLVSRAPPAATLALPEWLSTALPWMVGAGTAATGTGSIWLAVALAARFLRWRRQRRARKGGAAAPAAGGFPAGVGAIPRDTTEAFQLLQLSAMEGRSPLSDALLGRITLDELDNTIDAEPDGSEANWARRLKDTLLRRYDAIVPPALVRKES